MTKKEKETLFNYIRDIESASKQIVYDENMINKRKEDIEDKKDKIKNMICIND